LATQDFHGSFFWHERMKNEERIDDPGLAIYRLLGWSCGWQLGVNMAVFEIVLTFGELTT
jgi:hypothetical protein